MHLLFPVLVNLEKSLYFELISLLFFTFEKLLVFIEPFAKRLNRSANAQYGDQIHAVGNIPLTPPYVHF